MSVRIKIRGLQEAQRYLEKVPEEATKELRASVDKAAVAAHREALIQITRHYTIDMSDAARDFTLVRATGSSLEAVVKSSGRPRGASNFNISPKALPDKGWTSRGGYGVEITRGQSKTISNKYFWLRTRGGNTHLFRYKDGRSGYEIFKSVSTPQMFGNEQVMGKVEEVTLSTLEEVFARGMERRLSKEG